MALAPDLSQLPPLKLKEAAALPLLEAYSALSPVFQRSQTHREASRRPSNSSSPVRAFAALHNCPTRGSNSCPSLSRHSPSNLPEIARGGDELPAKQLGKLAPLHLRRSWPQAQICANRARSRMGAPDMVDASTNCGRRHLSGRRAQCCLYNTGNSSAGCPRGLLAS